MVVKRLRRFTPNGSISYIISFGRVRIRRSPSSICAIHPKTQMWSSICLLKTWSLVVTEHQQSKFLTTNFNNMFTNYVAYQCLLIRLQSYRTSFKLSSISHMMQRNIYHTGGSVLTAYHTFCTRLYIQYIFCTIVAVSCGLLWMLDSMQRGRCCSSQQIKYSAMDMSAFSKHIEAKPKWS